MNEIIHFAEVTMHSPAYRHARLTKMSLRVCASELCLVHVSEREDCPPMADLAQGLICPDQGAVRFLGVDWRDMSPYEQSSMRGRTRRVFENHGWVTNLTVRENVCIAQLHHTHRTEEDILSEANELGRAFGLSEIPSERPEVVRDVLLRRLEWVRTFLGIPALIVLEHPERGAPPETLGALVRMVARARAKGSAVICLTSQPTIWQDPGKEGVVTYRLANETLIAGNQEG